MARKSIPFDQPSKKPSSTPSREAHAAELKAHQEARRREREAGARLAAADPQASLRERLSQIDGQLLHRLKHMQQQKGDAVARRLERERAEILAKLGGGARYNRDIE